MSNNSTFSNPHPLLEQNTDTHSDTTCSNDLWNNCIQTHTHALECRKNISAPHLCGVISSEFGICINSPTSCGFERAHSVCVVIRITACLRCLGEIPSPCTICVSQQDMKQRTVVCAHHRMSSPLWQAAAGGGSGGGGACARFTICATSDVAESVGVAFAWDRIHADRIGENNTCLHIRAERINPPVA